ncbi:FAD:protein FMN transferase [Actinomycetospora endophytica]|uniref:FAD:protein FMN transferase n=1 Tax=Actinomycetospora endophytica TaxID=2291215 RepID=A0ABS8P6I3_9PSEU|nr:FAD:protein FMN transferase [Actinomycetospora endophytica]MCD2193016.1 FAD:protein FMN transferase [Actinomycetospora endophytica]
MTTATEPVARRVEHVMGLPISLALRGRHTTDPLADAAWAAALAALREADRMFSTYRDDSVVSAIRRGELAVADGPADLHEVLDVARRAERATGGAFSVWLPGPDGTTALDPSGVVKGWAVERAAAALRGLDGTDFCLSAGGDMVCRASCGPAWRIGIEDPRDPARLIAVVPVADAAVATSGVAHRGGHLVDARTGERPAVVAQVTVIATSLTWADVDATAAYALGGRAAQWLGQRVGRTGLVVWADGTTTTTQSPDRP